MRNRARLLLFLLGGGAVFCSVAVLQEAASRPSWTPEMRLLADGVEKRRGLKFKNPVGLRAVGKSQYGAAFEEASKNQLTPLIQDLLDLYTFFDGDDAKEEDLTDNKKEKEENAAGEDPSVLLLAIYDLTKKDILARAELRGWLRESTIQHEMGHALDDQYFDIHKIFEGNGTTTKPTCDEVTVARCVTEGSAECVSKLNSNSPAKQQVEAIGQFIQMGAEIDSVGGKQHSFSKTILSGLPALYLTNAAYADGSIFFPKDEDGELIDFPEKANFVFKNIPRSSEQILHPEKYWDPAKRDEPQKVTIPDLHPLVPGGFTEKSRNCAGEMGMAALFIKVHAKGRFDALTKTSGTKGEENLKTKPSKPFHGEGWDGDQFVIYTNKEGEKIFVWKTIWDTEEAAAKFSNTMPALEHYSKAARHSGRSASVIYLLTKYEGKLDAIAEGVGR